MLKRSTSNTSLFVMIVSVANPKLVRLKLLITLEKFRFWLGKPFQNGKYFMKMNNLLADVGGCLLYFMKTNQV